MQELWIYLPETHRACAIGVRIYIFLFYIYKKNYGHEFLILFVFNFYVEAKR